MMTYEEAVDFLNEPKYSQTRPGLGPVTELLRRLGDPQDQLKYVHIAGTNGKGSTAAMADSVLRQAGYKTGLYTSPYLERFTERIRVDGLEIGRDDLSRITQRVKDTVDEMAADGQTAPTIFEMVTAVAFLYFAEQKCDIVVLEVGMGGRLDATNVIKDPEVCAICAIDYDHMQFLGNTLEEIAHEKAGIIKPGSYVVSHPQEPEVQQVLLDQCVKMGAHLRMVEDGDAVVVRSDIGGQNYKLRDGRQHRIGMLGSYQIRNALVVEAAVDALRKRGWKISEDDLARGLRNARWGGRFELVSHKPFILIDGAHNPNGARALREGLEALFPGRKFTFIAGVLADKDFDSVFRIIGPIAERFVTVEPVSERALPAAKLAEFLRDQGYDAESAPAAPLAAGESAGRSPEGKVTEFTRDELEKAGREHIAGTPEAAVEYVRAKYPDSVIVAFGSLYYIGEIREYCRKTDK